MLARVTDDKEIEEVGQADLIRDTKKKEVTTADPNGEHFEHENLSHYSGYKELR